MIGRDDRHPGRAREASQPGPCFPVGRDVLALVGVVARYDVGIYPRIFHFAAQQRQALIDLIHIIIF
jgi:hypothetical protein